MTIHDYCQPATAHRLLPTLLSSGRKFNRKHRPFAFSAVEADGTFMSLDNIVCHGKAEAGAAFSPPVGKKGSKILFFADGGIPRPLS